ncbi:hypothetical protein [Micromonospora sp. NPDC007220]|uniref:hypothetical protein n=1 Tax=Micromonospora sp. NPDC007220 TaxID=3154318 RepID=UPI003401745B
MPPSVGPRANDATEILWYGAADLAAAGHLDPRGGPTPRAMFDRFVAWGPYRRPLVEPVP